MGPHAGQSREQILVLRQLNLRLGVGCLSAFCKYIENQACAVENLYLQLTLDIGDLLGCEVVVENSHTDAVVLHILLDFGKFALAYECAGVGVGQFLQKAFFGDGTCRVGEKCKLVEVFVGFRFVLCRCDYAYKDCAFRNFFIYD